ncbi:hypothetical protein ETH_00029620 [Eimeria tenella]|uniref:Uncharacterized protein n=1 Tax=Eimeria tenella TaxID=5802 RepID=U6KM30_EIMTE|nr:hypothetical protein ETH_00029620 [Eimeria tenella]CDJ39051.1 hypothetical protein ETH_00029620 [Eimeria tenella]|eukprot:XP_013229806.1 hypothetical protein ETH_00029620 [Eimeria tenella]
MGSFSGPSLSSHLSAAVSAAAAASATAAATPCGGPLGGAHEVCCRQGSAEARKRRGPSRRRCGGSRSRCLCLPAAAAVYPLYTRGGAAALGIQKHQQQQQHGFSADASDVCERSDEAAESHFPLVNQQQQQQQEQQQQQQLQPQLQQQQQVRGWLPLSDAATLPTEAGSSAATLQELLNPAALLEGSLEALHGPLAAQLAAVLDSSINSTSTSTSSCGITAFKIGLLLEQAAAATEQAIAAAVQNSPEKRLEREQHQQQQQQQRQPLLVRFLLDLSTRVLDRLETQWDSSALLLPLPQLSAAATAEWAPAAEEGAAAVCLRF